MKPMIIIDGQCYEVGPTRLAKSMIGSTYLDYKGHWQTCDSSQEFEGKRHILTLLPNDDERVVEHNLGVALWKLIPDGSKPRVSGDIRPTDGVEEYLAIGTMGYFFNDSVYNRIILRPPAPKPKSDREALQELHDATFGFRGNFPAASANAEKHLADTAEKK